MVEIADIEYPELTQPAVPVPPGLVTESQGLVELRLDPGTSRRTRDLAVYVFYVRLIGWKAIITYLVLCVGYIVTLNFSSKSSLLVMDHQLIYQAVWLQRWTNVNTTQPNERAGYYLGVYGAIAAAAVMGFLLSDWYDSPFHFSIRLTRMQSFPTGHDAANGSQVP